MQLCTADEIRKLERDAAEQYGVFPARLMDEAAKHLFDALMHDTPISPVQEVLILCGGGNNGADGYTLAALCREHGIRTSVIAVFEPQSALCRERAYSCNTLESPLFSFEGGDRALCQSLIEKATVIVDCVFGIGYDATRLPDERFLQLCRALSESSAFIISADMPSGLCADTGAFHRGMGVPALVFADLTVTFTASKPALETAPGLQAAGRVKVCPVGIPSQLLTDTAKTARLLDESVLQTLPPREAESSKANYGRLLSYCGSRDMTGAAVLAAIGALRTGVGLLTCTSEEDALSILKARLLEPIYLPFFETVDKEIDLPRTREKLSNRLANQSAILIGCGIGTGREQEALLETILSDSVCPIVCDADALTLLSGREDLLKTFGEKLILTPHPGEMGRLCRKTASAVQFSRISLSRTLAETYGCVMVLKGNRTVIASPDGRIAICPLGNAGMAKAGMGDLLAGMIASLAAQNLKAFDAACLGVYLHAKAGDFAKQDLGEACLLPTDVAERIPRAFTE